MRRSPRPYTARVPRLWIVCAALLVTGLLAPPAGAQTPLTAERFALLDAIYTTTMAVTKNTASAEDFAAARAACRALDGADPFLGPLRTACNASIKMLKPVDAFANCGTPVGCLRTARRARIAVNEAIRAARAANTAVDAAGLVDGCRRELRTNQSEMRLLERVRSLLALVQRVLTTGSPTLGRRVQRDADAVDRLADQQPSGARKRKQFRAACAPPPA